MYLLRPIALLCHYPFWLLIIALLIYPFTINTVRCVVIPLCGYALFSVDVVCVHIRVYIVFPIVSGRLRRQEAVCDLAWRSLSASRTELRSSHRGR